MILRLINIRLFNLPFFTYYSDNFIIDIILLGIIPEPYRPWRLITAGELLIDCIINKINVVECFRKNNWAVKYIKDSNTVSQDMKHYNITIATDRVLFQVNLNLY